MPQLKNKFSRKIGWSIYGLCGLLWSWPIGNLFIDLEDRCNATSGFENLIYFISFLFLHWLALRISQYFGLRDRQIKFFKDPALYWMLSLWVIALIAYIPPDNCSSNSYKARSAAASNTLAMIAKECFAKKYYAGAGTVIIPELKSYKSTKNNIAGFYVGNNRKLSGTSIVCPTTGAMKVVSEDESEYPTFSYNFDTGEKTCIADAGSDAEKRGCFNGRW